MKKFMALLLTLLLIIIILAAIPLVATQITGNQIPSVFDELLEQFDLQSIFADLFTPTTAEPAHEYSPPVYTPRIPYGFTEVIVTRVIDGDTIVLSNGERVRFIGMDAPEIGEPGADEATAFVRERVDGRIVWLEADGNDRDQFDRLRRYIWLQIPTDPNDEYQIRAYMLNAMMLEQGLASVMILGDVRHEELFRRLCNF